jgi:hypothetical protein
MEDPFDFIERARKATGYLTPSEKVDKEYKEHATAYYKEQHDLIEEQRQLVADQKSYTKTIKISSIFTVIATVVMAIATVFIALSTPFQCNKSAVTKDSTSVERSQKSDSLLQVPKQNQQ